MRERAGLEITLRVDETGRMPLPQERELWRIVQEAVVNVERHADASLVTVTVRCDGSSAEVSRRPTTAAASPSARPVASTPTA